MSLPPSTSAASAPAPAAATRSAPFSFGQSAAVPPTVATAAAPFALGPTGLWCFTATLSSAVASTGVPLADVDRHAGIVDPSTPGALEVTLGYGFDLNNAIEKAHQQHLATKNAAVPLSHPVGPVVDIKMPISNWLGASGEWVHRVDFEKMEAQNITAGTPAVRLSRREFTFVAPPVWK